MPTVTKPVLPKRSTVAGKVPLPTDLAVAEIAVNFADRKIYGKNPADNTVVPLGGAGQAFYNQESAPTGEINLGDEWFKPSTGTLYKRVSDGTTTIWMDTSAANAVATLTKYTYIATAGQTVFTGNDVNSVPLSFAVGSEIVTLNGVELIYGTDYSATSTSITLVSGATAGHELRVKAFGAFDVADSYTKAEVYTKGEINVANSAPIKTALNASGSAPIYACRAWVNFNGTGTVAIRASGNVSSITDNGVGDYTVNFTTAMPDANYSVSTRSSALGVIGQANEQNIVSLSTTSMRFRNVGTGTDLIDRDYNTAIIFR